MKFVDINGIYEVVVTPKGNLSDMSHDEIYEYLTNANNWLITTGFPINDTNTNLKYDPVNMGTYNYCAYDKRILGHNSPEDKEMHSKLDVKTFYNWGNVKGFLYGNSEDDRDQNGEYYDKYANKHVYEDYWKGFFE